METSSQIDNSIYHTLGDRWYTAFDDPVALLRAENKVKLPWIFERIQKLGLNDPLILDVGCGAGFLCNELAQKGFHVKGLDISRESLEIAKKYDVTGKVDYLEGDAYHLPFNDQSIDVITCLDFLEHVENPENIVKEASRVLKPNGLFFFHTFNRNPFAGLIIIKFVETFVKNTPKNMHVLDLFIRPAEMIEYCQVSRIEVTDMSGIRPRLIPLPLSIFFDGIVPESMEFTLTPSLLLSYIGVGIKKP